MGPGAARTPSGPELCPDLENGGWETRGVCGPPGWGRVPGGCQKTSLRGSVRVAEFFGTNPQVLVPRRAEGCSRSGARAPRRALQGSRRPRVQGDPAGGGDADRLAVPLAREVRERTDLTQE